MYSYQDKIAQICVTRDDYGQEFEWGKIDKVSNTAKTLLQAIIFTFLHELGHHIHAALRDIDKFRFGMTLRVIRTNAISNYAKSPLLQLEYFAETFAAWVLYRAELRLKDQFGYAMIAAALAVLELEIKELTA